jgi:hypothetical protein
MMPYVLIQDGVVVQKQQSPQEGFIEAPDSVVCGFLHDGSEFTAPDQPDPPPPVLVPSIYAVAQLTIAPGDIAGIDVNSRFSAALYMDVGSYLLFFTETQSDTSYLAKAYDAGARVAVTEKATDYIVITATDGSGDPTDPAEVSVEIIRVG